VFAKRTNWKLEANRWARALQAHRAAGKPLYDLTASNPTTCGITYPRQEILAALADPRALEYTPESKGLRSAREAVAAYYAGHGASPAIDPEHIILTAGTSEAYNYILRLLCEPGDEILAPAPSYPLWEYLATLNDVAVVPYQLVYDHGWQMDFGSVEAAISARTRAVLLVHPHNPTGALVLDNEARELTQLCADKQLAILSDEVFLDYADEPRAWRSFAQQDRALTFTLSGLSKVSALPQMKLAWLVTSGPPETVRAAVARLELIADTYLSPGTPVQLALPALLDMRRAIQAQLRARIAENLANLDRLLDRASAITRLERAAGWYAVLRVPATRSDEDLAIALLEQKSTLLHPGRFFDFPQDGFLVVSLIGPATEFAEAGRRLVEFFKPETGRGEK
jgi:alanine-synthesizing transaminase